MQTVEVAVEELAAMRARLEELEAKVGSGAATEAYNPCAIPMCDLPSTGLAIRLQSLSHEDLALIAAEAISAARTNGQPVLAKANELIAAVELAAKQLKEALLSEDLVQLILEKLPYSAGCVAMGVCWPWRRAWESMRPYAVRLGARFRLRHVRSGTYLGARDAWRTPLSSLGDWIVQTKPVQPDEWIFELGNERLDRNCRCDGLLHVRLADTIPGPASRHPDDPLYSRNECFSAPVKVYLRMPCDGRTQFYTGETMLARALTATVQSVSKKGPTGPIALFKVVQGQSRGKIRLTSCPFRSDEWGRPLKRGGIERLTYGLIASQDEFPSRARTISLEAAPGEQPPTFCYHKEIDEVDSDEIDDWVPEYL